MLPTSFESGKSPSFLSSTIDSRAALKRQCSMFRRVDDIVGDGRVRHLLRRVKHTQANARAEEPLHRQIEGDFVNQPFVMGDEQGGVGLAAVQLAAALDG